MKLKRLILKYLVVFPKIAFSENAGVLIGEILLIVSVLRSAFLSKSSKIHYNLPLIAFIAFIVNYMLISSFIGAISVKIFPSVGIFYFLRIILYVFIFQYAFKLYQTINNNRIVLQNYIIFPFILHYIFAISLPIIFQLTHNISINEVVWTTEVGYKLIPIAGMSIDFTEFFFLKVIGGGSGNLFSSWALLFIILIFNAPYKIKYKELYLILAFSVPIIGLSRGGTLTFLFYIIYLLISPNKLSRRIKAYTIGAFSCVIAFLAYLVIVFEVQIPILYRMTNTFSNGHFDGSTKGRFENYSIMFREWSDNIVNVFFGLGYDKAILKCRTGWSLVESFFLEVLFTGGVISFILLGVFFYSVFLLRKKNFWYGSLWQFLAFQSIFQWSITGGDFVSPHVVYLIMLTLGFGFAIEKKIKINL